MSFFIPPIPGHSDVSTEAIIRLGHEAGEAILGIYKIACDWVEKADQSPLTVADLESHQRIVEGLSALTPNIPVLSEESPQDVISHRHSWGRFWLIDPLDGTKEFLKRNGEFTVNIALIDQHRPVFGLVHVPALSLSYVGIPSSGAFRFRTDFNDLCPLRVQRPADFPYRVVGSRSHPSESLGAYLSSLADYVLEPVGSSLKFCRVAEGQVDLYPRFGPTSEWDTAAGQAVLEAAGGFVVDLQNNPLRYNLRDTLLNPFFLAFGDPCIPWIPMAGASSSAYSLSSIVRS
jgi:3'(2'), 5'-bisphosphate nucleotidase